jgi:hypothetical protein
MSSAEAAAVVFAVAVFAAALFAAMVFAAAGEIRGGGVRGGLFQGRIRVGEAVLLVSPVQGHELMAKKLSVIHYQVLLARVRAKPFPCQSLEFSCPGS